MNDPLFQNKLAFCVLAAILLVVGLPLIAESMFGGHGGGHATNHGGDDHGDGSHANAFPQYPVEIELASAAPKAEVKKVDIGTMMASAEMEKGAKASKACAACHSFDEGGPHLQGPNLWNVVGRPIGSIADFKGYSNALKNKEDVWSYENLSAFLYNSQEFAPGTGMNQKIRKDSKRADILAYLGSLSDSPLPYPEPAAIEVEPVDTQEETHSDTGE